MKKLATRLLPFFGFLFITAYIRSATVDVVYTDYIRIINSYLPDVWSFKPYMQPDILTRVPISYIERIISTVLFGYSTTFDMIMGALGLAFTALVIATYCSRKNVSTGITIALMLVVFALDKWEMLTNGTGWMHFWAFALFYLHYAIYDKIRSGEGKQKDEIALRVIPPIAIMLFAGPYCAIYFGAMIVVYAYDYFRKIYDTDKTTKKDWIIRFVALIIPFILFCISKYLSVDEYAGATDESLMQVIRSDVTLIPKMILKSFASMVIGGETAMEYGIGNKVLYLMGIFVIAGYVYAIYINIKTKLYKKTAFPMLLILSGLISHAIVVWGRWIFKSPDYMMSSRYALQFQSGILGIILTLFIAKIVNVQEDVECDNKIVDPKGNAKLHRALSIIFLSVILVGHLVTTGREINMAKYRKVAFENVEQVALNYRNETDETLKAVLQYSKPDKTRNALEILETQKWNVFRNGQ